MGLRPLFLVFCFFFFGGGYFTEKPKGELPFLGGPLNKDTVDGRNPAPPKKPRNDDSPVDTNTQ